MRRILILLSLLGGLLAASPAFASTGTAECLWAGLPDKERGKLEALEATEVTDALLAWVDRQSEEKLADLLARCGLTESDAGKAGGLLVAQGFRLAAERDLKGRWSAAELSQAFDALTPEQKDRLEDAWDNETSEGADPYLDIIADRLEAVRSDVNWTSLLYYIGARLAIWRNARDEEI